MLLTNNRILGINSSQLIALRLCGFSS